MEPITALTAVTVVLLFVGRWRGNSLRRLPVALRGGLAAMFLLTGMSHFVGMRTELIAMVPPALPAPEVLIRTLITRCQSLVSQRFCAALPQVYPLRAENINTWPNIDRACSCIFLTNAFTARFSPTV